MPPSGFIKCLMSTNQNGGGWSFLVAKGVTNAPPQALVCEWKRSIDAEVDGKGVTLSVVCCALIGESARHKRKGRARTSHPFQPHPRRLESRIWGGGGKDRGREGGTSPCFMNDTSALSSSGRAFGERSAEEFPKTVQAPERSRGERGVHLTSF